MRVVGVAGAHPPHYYSQEELLEAFLRNWGSAHHNLERVRQLHQAVSVGGRHLALPMEEYPKLEGFGATNDAFIRVGTDVAADALSKALDQVNMQSTDLDAIFFTSVTGIAAPSIDARLVNRLKLRTDIKRVPIFGLGCVAGAAGIARMYDYLRAWPTHTAALVSVELCSLTLQRNDFSIPNLISSGLFGDGGAAVIGVGAERGGSGPEVLATRSRFYYDTERTMGWDIQSSGFKVVLSASVPDVVRQYLRNDVDGFLADQGLSIKDIGSWVCHPGGPKVLQAFESVLEITGEDLALTWNSLREVGNLSSASVLLVLRDTLAERRPAPGTLGMVLALGPGFCSELVLVRW